MAAKDVHVLIVAPQGTQSKRILAGLMKVLPVIAEQFNVSFTIDCIYRDESLPVVQVIRSISKMQSSKVRIGKRYCLKEQPEPDDAYKNASLVVVGTPANTEAPYVVEALIRYTPVVLLGGASREKLPDLVKSEIVKKNLSKRDSDYIYEEIRKWVKSPFFFMPISGSSGFKSLSVDVDTYKENKIIQTLSCNSTALAMFAEVLGKLGLNYINGNIIRRGLDPHVSGKTPPPGSIEFGSFGHQGQDAMSVLRNIPMEITASRSGSNTRTHIMQLECFFEKTISISKIIAELENTRGILVIPSKYQGREYKNTGIQLELVADDAADNPRPWNSVFELIISDQILELAIPNQQEKAFSFFLTIEQQSIAVPNSISAILYQLGFRCDFMKTIHHALGVLTSLKRTIEN